MASIVQKKKMTLTEKKALLDKAADKINTEAKKIVCGRIGRTPEIYDKLNIEWIPTPSYRINKLTGGGFPKGKFSIIAGSPDSGKTTLLLETIAYNMRIDPDFMAIWLESENSITEEQIGEMLDIDTDRFFYIEHEKDKGAEGALEILSAVADSGCADICVINSLKALVPKTEIDNSLDKDTVALQARFNSKMIKKFTAMMQDHETAFIMVTHMTTNIGARNMHGVSYVLNGGRAIQYASMLTLELNKLSMQDSDPIKREDGMKIKVTCKKNHCVCNKFPYGAIEYFIRYGEGVAWELELLSAAIDMGILVSKGAWISEIDMTTGDIALSPDGSPLKWNGKTAFRNFILSDTWYRQHLESLVNGTFEIEQLSDTEIKEIQSDDVSPEDALKAYDPNVVDDPIKASRKK